jgi:hypothetical protein
LAVCIYINSNRPVYDQSKYIIEELDRKHKYIFQENITVFLEILVGLIKVHIHSSNIQIEGT